MNISIILPLLAAEQSRADGLHIAMPEFAWQNLSFLDSLLSSHQYQPRHTGNSWQFCATFCVCPGAFQGAIYLILREIIWPLQSPPTLRLGLDELSGILQRSGRCGNFGTFWDRGNSSIAFSVHVGLWPNDVQCPSLCPKWPSGECQHARHWTSSHPRMPKCVRDRLDHRATGLSCSCYDWADWADWADWMKPTIPLYDETPSVGW